MRCNRPGTDKLYCHRLADEAVKKLSCRSQPFFVKRQPFAQLRRTQNTFIRVASYLFSRTRVFTVNSTAKMRTVYGIAALAGFGKDFSTAQIMTTPDRFPSGWKTFARAFALRGARSCVRRPGNWLHIFRKQSSGYTFSKYRLPCSDTSQRSRQSTLRHSSPDCRTKLSWMGWSGLGRQHGAQPAYRHLSKRTKNDSFVAMGHVSYSYCSKDNRNLIRHQRSLNPITLHRRNIHPSQQRQQIQRHALAAHRQMHRLYHLHRQLGSHTYRSQG
jgi:hypothetical protein